jgi:hypothetical protein
MPIYVKIPPWPRDQRSVVVLAYDPTPLIGLHGASRVAHVLHGQLELTQQVQVILLAEGVTDSEIHADLVTALTAAR